MSQSAFSDNDLEAQEGKMMETKRRRITATPTTVSLQNSKVEQCSAEVTSATSGLLGEAERKATIKVEKLTSFRPNARRS